MKKTNEANITSNLNLEFSERERERATDPIVYNVYSSTDYKKFKKLKGNRDVSDARFKLICNSIEKIGYIKNPITINEKYEVIDGQGRLLAFEAMSLPVEYVIQENAGLKECLQLNNSSTNWRVENYINGYCDLGYENYILLRKLSDYGKKYVNITCIALLCEGLIGSGAGELVNKIKNAEFKLDQNKYDEIMQDLNYLETIDKYISMIGGRKSLFQSAFIWAIKNTDATKQTITNMISKRHDKFTPPADVKTTLKQFTEVYNFHKNIDNCIYFEQEYRAYMNKRKSNQRSDI